jgi:hypothetical protein
MRHFCAQPDRVAGWNHHGKMKPAGLSGGSAGKFHLKNPIIAAVKSN